MHALPIPEPYAGAASTPPLARADRAGYFVAGTGTPVVLLHASLGSKSQWTVLAERLAARYRVIGVDLWGYGDAPMPAAAPAFTLDDEMLRVAQCVDRLVAPHVRVHLIGHSYGGMVALRCAQGWRGRVASLALYEPVAFGMLDADDPALADAARIAASVTRLVDAGRRDEATERFVDFWSGTGSYASLSLRARVSLARRIDKVPLDFQAALGWPRGPESLRGIVASTLLLTGHRSPAVARRIHAALAHTLQNRSLAAFEAGHMAPVTEGHRVNPWFEAFLDLQAERDAACASPRADASALHAAAAQRGGSHAGQPTKEHQR